MLFVSPEHMETFPFILGLPDAAIGERNCVRGERPAHHGLLLRRRIGFFFQRLLLAGRDRFFRGPEMSFERTVQILRCEKLFRLERETLDWLPADIFYGQ